ncbi:hypothetical protein ACJJIE_01155 [Microbulbifer sp. TRSA001]|uniref:hypothetical protein n=1 Tax=Microbulbifer sp. TRSA001 TaxID=3243381 RepID=UPI004039A41B
MLRAKAFSQELISIVIIGEARRDNIFTLFGLNNNNACIDITKNFVPHSSGQNIELIPKASTQVYIKACRNLRNPPSRISISKLGNLSFYTIKASRDQHLLLDSGVKTNPQAIKYSNFTTLSKAHTKSCKADSTASIDPT